RAQRLQASCRFVGDRGGAERAFPKSGAGSDNSNALRRAARATKSRRFSARLRLPGHLVFFLTSGLRSPVIHFALIFLRGSPTRREVKALHHGQDDARSHIAFGVTDVAGAGGTREDVFHV